MNFQDPISPTLSDMPTEILVQVLEKLGSMEQLICRKVCQSLRTTIKKFGIYFDSIWFYVWNDHVVMYLNGLYILYNDAANGASKVTCKNKETIIKEENFMQVAFNNLSILLKHVREFDFIVNVEDKHAKATFLLHVLKAEQCVHVKKITLANMSLNNTISILSSFNSQMLESIALNCDDTNNNFEQLAQLDQWKNSKECIMFGFLGANNPIEHLLYFKNITVGITIEKVVEIRNKLLKRNKFEQCILLLENSNLIDIARVFQPHYSGSGEFEIEYLCDNAKFKISWDEEDGFTSRLLFIRRCKL